MYCFLIKKDACIKHNVMIIAMNVDFDAITTSYNICGFNIKAKIIFKKLFAKFFVFFTMFFRMCDSTFFSYWLWKPWPLYWLAGTSSGIDCDECFASLCTVEHPPINNVETIMVDISFLMIHLNIRLVTLVLT